MAAIITDKFRKENAAKFIDEINIVSDSPATEYYMGIGKRDPWEDGAPEPVDSEYEKKDFLDNLFLIKAITDGNAVTVIPTQEWDTGGQRIYKTWDPSDLTCLDKTGELYPCYIVTAQSKIYVCLAKEDPSAPAKVKPTSTTAEINTFTDGYTWVLVGTSSTFSTGYVQPTFSVPTVNENKGVVFNYRIDDGGLDFVTNDVVTILNEGVDDSGNAVSFEVEATAKSVSGGVVTHLYVDPEELDNASPADTNIISLNATVTSANATLKVTPLLSPIEGFGAVDILSTYYVGLPNEIPEDVAALDADMPSNVFSFRQASIIKAPTVDTIDAQETYGCASYMTFATLTIDNDNVIDETIIEQANTGAKAFVDYVDTTANRIYFHRNNSDKVNRIPFNTTDTFTLKNGSETIGTELNDATAIVTPENGLNCKRDGDVFLMQNFDPIRKTASDTIKVNFVIQF